MFALVFLTICLSLFSIAEAAPLAPEIAINSVVVNEAAGSATFTVTLSEPGDTDVTVNYTTIDNTALGGLDFNAASGHSHLAYREQYPPAGYHKWILDDGTSIRSATNYL